MISRLQKAHRALALLGPSTHCRNGAERRGRIELENFVSDETDEPVEQVREWAARQWTRIQAGDEETVLDEIDKSFTYCEGRR